MSGDKRVWLGAKGHSAASYGGRWRRLRAPGGPREPSNGQLTVMVLTVPEQDLETLDIPGEKKKKIDY